MQNEPHEMAEELKELEAQMAEIKQKISAIKQERRKPSDIIYTPEYGWVKKLPCGPGENVWTWEITYKDINWRNGDKHAARETTALIFKFSNWSAKEYLKRSRKWQHIPAAYIRTTEMRISYYPYFGRYIFKTEEEARAAMMEWLGEYAGKFRTKRLRSDDNAE